MRVLAVASEMQGLIKTGGLADVVAALPGALAPVGIEVTTLLPGYPAVMQRVGAASVVGHIADLFGMPARVLRTRVGPADLLVLDAPALYDRPGGPYADSAGRDWPDNWRRFAALARTAAEVAAGAIDGYWPDLLHAHDWQAGLVPAYLRFAAGPAVPSVMTIHNLAFQGWVNRSIFPALGLPDAAYALDGVEYFGGVGYLKAGLQCATAITTVSPSYAEEILAPEHGMGLQGLLNHRAEHLHGIVNGIDTDEWDPSNDRHLVQTFSRRTLARRAANRRAIERRYRLQTVGGPIFCIISRLTTQKGIDIVARSVDALVDDGGRLAVLGSGDHDLEDALRAAAARHPGRVGVVIGYDEGLAHQLQAGADAILIPSRFEPCGLTQLYGLRYGCVPVVARTGGLADTIIDANEAALIAGVATGLHLAPPRGPDDTAGLRRAVHRAIALHAQPAVWRAVQRRGMAADFAWARSAERYASLFRTLRDRQPA